jgi:sugar lactone lactonase YvrE
MAANLIRVDTTGCNLDYIVYLSTSSGGYLTVKDSGINPSFFTSNANAIVISTTSGQTLFDGNTREYIRSPKGSLSFTLTNSRWRLLNTVPYTPLGDAVLSNVVTTDLSIFGSFCNYVDFIVPNTMNVFGGFESQPLPTIHSVPVITAMDITSTVAGLGSLGYLSSPGTLESNLVSTVVGLGGYGYISMSQLTSTASGLGSFGYISQATLHSTLGGLGTFGYVSTTSFVSSIRGLSMIYISSSSLPSTVNGLGTVGYISMPQFTSSIIGISSIYASNIYSTITYLGGSNENQPGFYTVTTTGSNGPFASPRGVVRDSVGNIYVADSSNHTIRKIDASGAVTTVAGSTAGFADGTNGQFNSPQGISFDGSNIYVADTGNNRIRMVVPGVSTTVSQVMVTTLAGSTVGCNNGPAASAQFSYPFGVAVDSAGIIYVADSANYRIRKIDINSNVTTLAGSTQGFANGQGIAAKFGIIASVAVDSAGSVYVADQLYDRIRKIDRNSNVTTLAGSTSGYADGQGTAAQFYRPLGITVDSAGIVYVADAFNHRIRKIDSSSNVTTLAGTGASGYTAGGFADGPGTASKFNHPEGVAVDSTGIIYVADTANHRIRKIDINSNVTTLAGSGIVGCNNGQGTAAQFYNPQGVAVDSTGIVYVADNNNNVIRKIDRSSNVTTLAGSGIVGCNNGPGTAAQFNILPGVAVDSAGIVYVADYGNHRIRKITTESITTTTSLVTTVAGSNAGFADGANGQFSSPQGISITGSNIYVADTGNNRIRLITPGVTTTVSQLMVTTLAGSTQGSANAQGTAAQFNYPSGIAVDSAGIIYVADYINSKIRKIDINSNVTTLAGSGAQGSANGQGTAAQFFWPYGITVDSSGIIYVADYQNYLIRKIDRNSNVTTFAGSGTPGSANGQGTAAQFNQPKGVAVDSAGFIYVTEADHRIRKIDRSSNVTTLAGSTVGCNDGQGTAARFFGPSGVAVDSAGIIYVADTQNHRIRKIDTSSNVTTLAGSTRGFANGQGTAAQFNLPTGIIVDSAGILYIADYFNHRIRTIDRNSNVTTLAGSTQGFSNAQGTAALFNFPQGVVVDSAGILYVADKDNHRIRKIATESITTIASVVTTVAGSNAGFADGSNAQFSSPQGISITGSNIYVADTGNHRIRLIAPGTTTTVSQLTLTTLAGSTLGSANAQGIAAQFNSPNGLAFDSSGNVYIADTTNHRIRKIDINSNVTTLAGSTQGFADGQGTAAQFFQPTGLMLDSSGNLYVGDRGNNRIRKIDPSSNVTTVAGSTAGFADGTNGQFNSPQGISFDGSNIYVADTGNNRIRLITPGVTTTVSQVMVTTLAGSFDRPTAVAVDSAGNVYLSDLGNLISKIDINSNATTLAGIAGFGGSADGPALTAQFYVPTGVAVDSAGIVYIADNFNNRIRKLDRSSNVSILAGIIQGFSNAQGPSARFYRAYGVAVDSAGIVYVADQFNNRIRKIDINSNVTTLAGSGVIGCNDGQGVSAQFNYPQAVAVDSAGIIYIADSGNNRIRKIDISSNVTTLAGSTIGFSNAQGINAQFSLPSGLTVDSAGIIYVADYNNHVIRKIDRSSNVTTFAGSTQGFSNGQGTAARFNGPSGVAVDTSGSVYVADSGNNGIRKITTESITTTTSLVTTVAGSNAGFADGANGQFNSPQGISITGSNIYVADTGNNRIRLITPGVTTTVSQAIVTTLAGSTSGFANGQGTAAQFTESSGIAVDSAGIIYVADAGNNRIRKIDTSSNVTTLAGSGTPGSANGQGTAAQFYQPFGVAVDSAGIVYVADSGNHRIRKIDRSSNVTTLAGSTVGCNNGPGTAAQFNYPWGVAVDSAGIIYVADNANNRIRKIDTSSNVTTLAGSTQGSNNGPGTSAQFYAPWGVAVDSAGIVYVCDTGNNRIRKIDINSNVTTLAGSTQGFSNGQGIAAQFINPSGVAVDSAGIIYVADQVNHLIRKIDTSSNVTTFAGSTQGCNNGPAASAQFFLPFGVAVDSAGIVYVADAANHRIRKIATESITTIASVVTTVAGSNAGFADGANAQFSSPQGISITGSNIYVADTGNHRIRLIAPGTTTTVSQLTLTTLAGSTLGSANAQGIAAQFNSPNGLAFDSSGIIYIADTTNHRIRKIDINSNVTTLAGSTQGFADGQGTAAQFFQPTGLMVDSSGNLYVGDRGNNRIRKIDPSSNVTTVAGSTAGFADGSNGQFNSPQGIFLNGSNIYVADTGNNRIRMVVPGASTTVSQLMVTTLAGSTQGSANAQGTSAQFAGPYGVAVDSAGIIYVADTLNNRIRKIDRSSNVTTLAGSTQGFSNAQGTAALFNRPYGIAVDSAGSVYVADTENNRIRKIDINSNVTTLAGSTQGFANGQGTSAQFYWPSGVAVDSAGILYVADRANNRIRTIDRSSNVTTLAGSTSGFSNGQGTAARFNNPHGVAVDSAGIIYVADFGNHRIRKIDINSNVTTLAGSTQGSANGQGINAQFNFPHTVAVDSAGIIYVADTENNLIRKIDTSSNVTTFAGSTQGFSNAQGTAAQFSYPRGIAVDSAGSVYVADTTNNLIRKITTESITTIASLVTTVAGSNAGFADGANGQFSSPQGISITGSNIYVADTGNNRIRLITPGNSTTVSQAIVTTLAGSTIGCNNGPAASAQFFRPTGVAVDSAGIIYIADWLNHRIRKIDRSSNVTTLAGSTQGFANGQGTAARFNQPYGVAVDSAGIIYVADFQNHRIRKIDINSNVTTLAGSTQGFANAQGTAAQFNSLSGVAVDSAGIIYVADTQNHRIRKIDINSNVTTLAGSTQGFANGQGAAAQFYTPSGLTVDSAGIVYVADYENHRIRKIDTSSNVTTLAGSIVGCNDGQGINAQFYQPTGVAVDSAGIIYVADYNNNRIRKIDINSNVTTLAGSGAFGFANGQGTAAQFFQPFGVAVDSAGIIYVADYGNNLTRKITTESITTTTSLVTTVAGSNAGFADGSNGQFNSPQGISITGSNIYVADTGNHRIRLIAPGTTTTVSQAMVTTLAGSTVGCNNGPAASAQFNFPYGIAVDSAGIIYVADFANHRIRKIDTLGNVTTLAGSTQGFANGQGTAAQFSAPAQVAVDSAGNLYICDPNNHRIRKIDRSSNVTTLAGSTPGFANGQGTAAQFNVPSGVAVDSAGSVYVADTGNNRIRKIDINSNVTTFAGSGAGFLNAQGSNAQFYAPYGIAVDSAGIIYVADYGNHRIRKIDTSSNVTTLAGSTIGCNDGPAGSAQFNNPDGVTVDSAGIVYVGDPGNNRIRKIDRSSNVTTLAGSTQGFSNGPAASAQFYTPTGVAVDSAGNVYVADSGNNRIRKITTESITTTTSLVTTVAGSNAGFADGSVSSALLSSPGGILLDGSNIYVADTGNNRIRKIATESITTTASLVTTVAGSTAGFANGPVSSALLSSPGGILLDGSNIYVADTGNNRIRKIATESIATTTSVVTTVAGSTAGFADGSNALFSSPQGVSLDGSTLYVADAGNNRIRKIDAGIVTTISGCNAGFSNGPASNALFSSPGGIFVDGTTIYVADTANNRIRKLLYTEGCNSFAVGYVSSQTLIYTIANLTSYTSKEGLQSTTTSLSAMDSSNLLSTVRGLGQYYISTATLTSSISGVRASGESNQAAGYISSLTLNSSIEGLGTLGYISISHYISSFSNLISTGPIGYASTLDGIGSLGFISTATLVSTVEGLGSLGYISSSSPLVSTVQGLGQTYISTASLVSTMSNYISTMSNYPTSSNQSLIDVGPIVSTNTGIGRIFVDEESTVSTLPIGAINAVTLFSGTACLSKSSGIVVSTVAGSTQGSADGQGTAAQFYFPNGVIVDSAGIIYVADQDNNRIRKIDTSSNVTTLAGSSYGFADGQGTAAQFFKPSGIAVDSAGNLYVADSLNFRIRKIDTSSNVTTLAGSTQGFSNAQGTAAQFLNPFGVAVDSAGIVYVADYGGDQIRKIDINSNVTTLAGGIYGYADGQGTAARFTRPYGVALDSAGIIYVADYGNNRIRKIDRNSNVTTLAGSTYGYADGQGTAAKFYPPYGLAVDSAGSVYVSDSTSCVIRKIDTSSNVTTFAGIVGSNGSNNGPATSARFDFPWGVAVDSAGIIYVADAGNDQIRKIVVGSPNIITSNDSYIYYANTQNISIASLTNYSNARLFSNTSIYRGITNDSINIYATSGNSILAYSILTLSNSIIANTTNTASFVNGTNAATVTFSSPSGIAIDSTLSNLYVCDTGNNSIRKVQLNPLSVTTIATITSPLGIAVDSYSTYAYVTDTAGNITRVSLLQRNSTTLIASNLGTMYSITLDPTNTYAYVTRYTANLLTTVNLITGQIKSTGSGILAVTNGTGSGASFSQPFGIVYTLGNFLYIADNGGIRETTTQVYLSTSIALGGRATATTIAPTTTLTNQVTGQCVYLSNTSLTTTPFISLTPTTVNISANLYANTVTAATFTASSGTSASGLGYFFGDGTYVTTISDIRTKENIQPIEHALSTVRSLQAVEYTKVDDPSRRWLGYIAQDVEDSIPEIVTSSGEEEWRSIQYTNLPGLIIEAIKELKQKYERILALVSTAPSVSAPSVSAPSVSAPSVSAPSVSAPSAPSVSAPSAPSPSAPSEQ